MFVPASRANALSRALVWSVPTSVLGGSAFLIFRSLNFSATGVNNRLVDYMMAVGALPLAIGGLVAAFMGVRWLLLAFWPGRVGVFACGDKLALRLGPFGAQGYDAARIETRYPFEISSGDEDEGAYEAFLPEDEQRATLLPRMRHPLARTSIDRKILRFVAEGEKQLAEMLRPVIDSWRRASGDDS